jgi:hypothetical protein
MSGPVAPVRETVIPVMAGSAVFLAVQMLLFWVSEPIPEIDHSGWFLNSPRGVLVVGVAMAGVGGVFGSSGRDGVIKATMSASGATLAMMATLFAIGPGTIFPIVIFFGAAIIAGSVALGAAVGIMTRQSLGTRRRNRP